MGVDGRTLFSRKAGLATQHGIDIEEIAARKAMIGLTETDERELRVFAGAASALADLVTQDFYRQQILNPQIRQIIGDGDRLARLMESMEEYVVSLFAGEYGLDYVSSRLRIGHDHARIGVPPKLYLASLFRLKEVIGEHLMLSGLIETPPKALDKIIIFDLQLVLDTYMSDLVVEQAYVAADAADVLRVETHVPHMPTVAVDPLDDMLAELSRQTRA